MGKRLLIIAAGLAVAACGGGGGGGGGGTSTGTVSAATASITSANAVTVAGTTTDAALFSTEFDELANLGILGSPGGVAVVQSAAGSSVTLAKQTASLQAVSVGPEVENCTFGGTLTISATIENPETLSAGDTFSLSYANCDFGEGMVANGSIGFTVTSFQGDLVGNDFDLGFDLRINGFSMVEAAESVSMDGDFSMSLDSTATGTTVTISGESLSLGNGTETYVLSEFSTTTTVDMSMFPESVTVQTSGFLMSSEFDGEVHFTTSIVLQGSGEGNPFSGEFVITGANEASITVIPMDEQNVRIELDLDGDGAVDPDGVIDTTWQELLGTPVAG